MTSLRLSPDAQTLLSNSHDGTVRTWDVRPFAPADRRVRTYDGAPTGMERNLLKAAWGAKGARIAAPMAIIRRIPRAGANAMLLADSGASDS